MVATIKKFSGEKWPRKRGVDDQLDAKADAGAVGDSGLTANAYNLVGNPRAGESDVQSLAVEGLVEWEEGIVRFLADATTSEGLDQFAETSSAELAGVISDETGTGALVFADTPTLETPAVIGRITRNGRWVTPFINVQADHDASGVGGEDQSAELAAAIQEANLTGRELLFPSGDDGPAYYDFSSLPNITTNGVGVRGHGPNAVYLRNTGTGSSLTCTNQFPYVSGVTFWPLAWKTGAYEVVFNGTYRGRIENCLFQYHHNAIQILDSATPSIENCTMLYASGTAHIYMVGTSSIGTFGTFIDRTVTNNPFPTTYGVFKAWGLSTAFTAGQLTYENGWCWQCVTSGTTAGSGTMTPSTANSYAWTQNDVTHGTAVFRAVQKTNLFGVLMDNYAYTLGIGKTAFINGAYGVGMVDSAAAGSSFPMWITATDLQTDHCFFGGIYAAGGLDINIGQSWIGSTLAGSGIYIGPDFKGCTKITASRIAFNAHHGVLLDTAPDTIIIGNQFTGNGAASAGTYHGVYIASDTEDFDISHNIFGDENGLGTNYTNTGVYVDTGTSDNYTIAHNRGRGLTGETVFDGGSGVNKSVFRNLPLTLNRDNLIVVSGTTHTLGGSEEVIRFDPSGACTVTMLSGAQYEGKEVVFYNITTNTVSSGSSNIGPLAGGAAGTAILPGTAGSWARLKYNHGDTIWYIIAAG